MKKESLKFFFGIMVCVLLAGYGVSFAQTEESQTQSEESQTQTGTAEEEAEAPPPAEAEEAAPQRAELPVPLEAEMTVAEHWSKNPYPRTMPVGARVHIVEKGDTLWDLAQRYYANPLLWPQIWEVNNYIPNAHWIYPGDPIVIPPLVPITEEKIAEEVPPPPPPPVEEGGPAVAPPEKPAWPIALDLDLYCSGYITPTVEVWKLKIIGNEENIQKISLSWGDVVYINQGEAEGVSPGDEFTILHHVRKIEHPVTLKDLGEYILQTGRLKVVATQEHTSTAQVTYACDATLVGDYLIPFEPREVPVFTEFPPVDRYSLEGPNAKGYVVFTKDDLGSVGLGHEVQIDLGAKDGVTVGTRLIVYRPNTAGYEGTGFEKDIPRRVLGEMVVYNVQDATATGRIIMSYDFAQIGDRVEVR